MCRTIRLKRSNEDKRKAVSTLLNDAEWSQRSDRWVSETAGVGHHLVRLLHFRWPRPPRFLGVVGFFETLVLRGPRSKPVAGR